MVKCKEQWTLDTKWKWKKLTILTHCSPAALSQTESGTCMFNKAIKVTFWIGIWNYTVSYMLWSCP